MATFNYAKVAATAKRLVAKYGTTVTLVQLNRTPSDPAKPHLGPTDPLASPVDSLSISAVFVEPSDTSKLGIEVSKIDFLKRATKIAITAAPTDPSVFDKLQDADGTTWSITGASSLNPGGTAVVHFVGLTR